MLQAPLLKLSRAKDDQHEVVQQKKLKKLLPLSIRNPQPELRANSYPGQQPQGLLSQR